MAFTMVHMAPENQIELISEQESSLTHLPVRRSTLDHTEDASRASITPHPPGSKIGIPCTQPFVPRLLALTRRDAPDPNTLTHSKHTQKHVAGLCRTAKPIEPKPQSPSVLQFPFSCFSLPNINKWH